MRGHTLLQRRHWWRQQLDYECQYKDRVRVLCRGRSSRLRVCRGVGMQEYRHISATHSCQYCPAIHMRRRVSAFILLCERCCACPCCPPVPPPTHTHSLFPSWYLFLFGIVYCFLFAVRLTMILSCFLSCTGMCIVCLYLDWPTATALAQTRVPSLRTRLATIAATPAPRPVLVQKLPGPIASAKLPVLVRLALCGRLLPPLLCPQQPPLRTLTPKAVTRRLLAAATNLAAAQANSELATSPAL